MFILITYDIGIKHHDGEKRLRNVAKICQNYGVRVQNSVFECIITNLQFEKLKYDLENTINTKYDSIRYYNLGKDGRNKVTHIGNKITINVEDVLII